MVFHITFMLALFHDKKCCNCINLFPCILWDLFVSGLALSWWRLLKTVKFATCLRLTYEWTTHKRSHKKHMLEVEEWSAKLYFASYFATWLTRKWPAKLSVWMILSMTLIPFTHTICTLISHKIIRRIFKRKPKKGFYNTHILKIELLILNREILRSLFSFPSSIVIP